MKIDRAVIEINGQCNYRCKMCPQSSPGREPEFLVKMSLEDFENVVKDCVQHGLNLVNLDGSGEATFNKDFVEYIKIVKKYGSKCFVFSNGFKMSGQFMKDAVDAGLDFFRFSVIGYNESIYKKWMNSNNFYKVIRNIKEMKAYVDEVGSRCDVAVYSLISDIKNKEYEVEQYKNLFKDIDIKLEIWSMHNWSGVYKPNEERQGRIRTCGRPFSPDIVVRAGGIDGHKLAVHPCCQVLGRGRDREAVLGHMDTDTIESIWNDTPYIKLRDKHTSRLYPSYCKDCDFLIDDSEVLIYTNHDRKLHKMHGTEFTLHEFRDDKK